MRVEVGKKVRVGPGDLVVIRGQLAAGSKIGRLFVFAREGDAEFSPYVANVSAKLAVVGERPTMYSPMSLRLDEKRPERETSFVSDIDGWVRVMQEIDRPTDARAVIRIKRTVDPSLPWWPRCKRIIRGAFAWK